MLESIRSLYARIVLNMPFLRHPGWDELISIHAALLDGTFPSDPYARLLTLRLLEAMYLSEKPRRAARLLNELDKRVRTDKEKALTCVLRGEHHMLLDQIDDMCTWFRKADAHGHRYHKPHVLLGIYSAYDLRQYDDALAEFDKALDCLYGYLPLDEEVQRIIALVQTNRAFTLTMMQRTEEAEAALERAASIADTPEYLRAAALLHALHGRQEEARKAMSALKELDEEQYDIFHTTCTLLLEGTHPHFVPKVPNEKFIRDYWTFFAENEEELIRLIREGGDAWAFQDAAFLPLAPESNEVDHMTVDFSMDGDTPCVTWAACYSRNYDALITALIAACPAGIAKRWRISREP